MEPTRVYDYLRQSRERVLENVRPLGPDQYSRTFPIGPGSLGRALTHLMISEWYYVQRIAGRDVPPYEQWPIKDESPPPFATLETVWAKQAADTRAALDAVRDWSAEFEYRVTSDDGRLQIVTASAGDLFTQLVMHEVHHRAQVLNMLRQLGVTLEDLDFNARFKRRDAPQ